MRRTFSILVVSALCVLGAVTATQAAIYAYVAAKHSHKPVHHAKLHGLGAPSLISPADGAHVQQIPALTWSAVGGAAEYEYQLSADEHFNSIVLGSGIGKGTNVTHNLAAALSQPIPDSAKPLYWRVRGLTASKERGPWSSTRRLFKAWTAVPQLLGPADGAAIAWPRTPLVLSWTAVPYATQYIVTIATDAELSNIVLGSASSPQKTTGTVFALPGTLPVGRYYWAIRPVDAEGHRGAYSAVRSFTWSWPTGTATQVNDLNPDPRALDPQFSWGPIPGASKYEVEVNSAVEFPAGSKWCCSNTTIASLLSPTEALANNGYYWRVRGLDASGNAGEWNVGAQFTKAFDGVTPTIPSLTMSDTGGHPLPAGTATSTPIITWSPVPGAASYEVQVTRFFEGAGCDWAAPLATEKQTVETAGLAWTPLGELSTRIGPVPEWPTPDSLRNLNPGQYCARVLARSDTDGKGNQVVSNWTQIGGLNHVAFTFLAQPAPGSPRPEGFETQAGDYLGVRTGATPAQEESCPGVNPETGQPYPCRSTPLFTWKRVPGATEYYVVVARDSLFTHVIDVASTVVPAYAPQLSGEMPLDDETTTYYWAVVPVKEGRAFSLPPEQDAPHEFNKSSEAPTPRTPLNGETVSTQPTFSWTEAHTRLESECPEPRFEGRHCLIWDGALNYTLQVSADPTFGKPLDNIRTDSTAYSSSTTFPADTTLYWRVRANTANSKTEGLHWSPVQTFRRTLPPPSPGPGNPTSGQGIPLLSWTPVAGATAYEVHVEQADGATKDFTLDSTMFTPTELFFPGTWRWEARALFPTNSFSTVPSGYFGPQSFTHTVAPPTGVSGTKSGSRVVIAWNPDPFAKEYEVDIATSDTFSFSSSIDNRRVEGTSWAPDIDFTRPANRGTLFWRVAAIDERGESGPFAEGQFVAPRPAARCKLVKVKVKGKTKSVKKCASAKKKH
jgi:hypothetical protein